jgi:hypothetical protein
MREESGDGKQEESEAATVGGEIRLRGRGLRGDDAGREGRRDVLKL